MAFTDNRIVDGPGPDFTVFENPFNAPGLGIFTEVGVVAASADGVTFVEFPHGAVEATSPGSRAASPVYANPDTNDIDPRDPGVSGGDQFDLATIGLTSARYLRITDPGAAIDDVGNHFPTPGPGKSGFDLDAVVALHSENTCAACCDADGNGSVKPNDVLLLLRARVAAADRREPLRRGAVRRPGLRRRQRRPCAHGGGRASVPPPRVRTSDAVRALFDR